MQKIKPFIKICTLMFGLLMLSAMSSCPQPSDAQHSGSGSGGGGGMGGGGGY